MTYRHSDRAETLRRLVTAASCLFITFTPLGASAQSSPEASQTAPSQSKAGSSAGVLGQKQLRDAEDAYLAGARLLDHGDLSAAEKQFDRAAKLNSKNAEYIQAAALAREHRVTELVQQSGKARLLGHKEEADKLLAMAQQLDPANRFVAQHLESSASGSSFHPQIEAVRADTNREWSLSPATIAGPIALEPKTGIQSFQIRSDSRQTLSQVLARYGIKASFDDSVENKTLRFDVGDVTYERATAILFEMANVFAVPLDAHSVLIAKDDNESRQRLERLLEETIYVPGLSVEQMNELGTLIRSVFDVKQTAVQTAAGSLVLRAPEDTLTAVNLTLADLIDGNPEVVLDMRLYSIDRSHQRKVGAQLPQQIGVYNVESEARKLVSSNQDLVNQAIAQGLIPADASDITIALALISSGLVTSSLLSNTIGFLGGGLTMSGITANASTTFNLSLNSSDTRALDNIVLRIGDRQSAEFRSGTRYPITTATYSTPVLSSNSGLAGTTINGVSAQTLANSLLGGSSALTIPQIQYEDLGLIVKASPTVLRSGLVRMKLDLRIEALAGGTLNGIPVLGHRQYTSDITVGDGETTLIASSLSKTESGAISGIPFLSELPGFQTASGYKTTETDSSELVLLITPHIVRHRSNESAGPRIAYNQRLPY
jgi:type II secretory pathway component GspD/PulD (secretin)